MEEEQKSKNPPASNKAVTSESVNASWRNPKRILEEAKALAKEEFRLINSKQE